MLNDSTCGEPDAFSRVKIPRLDLQHPERLKVTSGRNVVDRHTIKATIACPTSAGTVTITTIASPRYTVQSKQDLPSDG